jgi:hypothetical protein
LEAPPKAEPYDPEYLDAGFDPAVVGEFERAFADGQVTAVGSPPPWIRTVIAVTEFGISR